jgi:hypothetical protein
MGESGQKTSGLHTIGFPNLRQLLLTPNIFPSGFLMNRLASASVTLSVVNCGFVPSNLQEANTCSTMNFGWK